MQLSWDGGTTWTAAKTSANLTTTLATYTLGNATDNWGRAWSVNDFSNPNFRVRLINIASNTSRDFTLDWVAVRVHYAIPPPQISTLSPNSGSVGAQVTIDGSNFGTSAGTVTFNNTAAAVSSWTDNQIIISVPPNATSGPVVVTSGGIASNGVTFTVAPRITSLSPNLGPVGTSVTISGANFGSAGTVTFNGTPASPSTWSSTNITVPVPQGATSGLVVVTVNGLASNGMPFKLDNHLIYMYELGRLMGIVDPLGESAIYSYDAAGNLLGISRQSSSTVSIIAINPKKGPAGASVTISGTAFSTVPSENIVTFNGIAATVLSSSATEILTTVPSGATSGPIAVTNENGNATSSTSFTVTTP